MLRLLHVSCDIEVEPQKVIVGDEGEHLGRADLWLVDTNTIHEYDGADHLEHRRQRKDLARARRLGDGAVVRRGYTAPDVLHQATSILRDADRSLGRRHRPERIRAFHAMVAASSFSASGRLLLQQRLNLGPWQNGARREDAPA